LNTILYYEVTLFLNTEKRKRAWKKKDILQLLNSISIFKKRTHFKNCVPHCRTHIRAPSFQTHFLCGEIKLIADTNSAGNFMAQQWKTKSKHNKAEGRSRQQTGWIFRRRRLGGAYSNHPSHANVNAAVKVSMKCSMEIKCANNRRAKANGKRQSQKESGGKAAGKWAGWAGESCEKRWKLCQFCAAFSRFLGIENMAYMEMPRKSTFFLLPLRLSIGFMSLN